MGFLGTQFKHIHFHFPNVGGLNDSMCQRLFNFSNSLKTFFHLVCIQWRLTHFMKFYQSSRWFPLNCFLIAKEFSEFFRATTTTSLVWINVGQHVQFPLRKPGHSTWLLLSDQLTDLFYLHQQKPLIYLIAYTLQTQVQGCLLKVDILDALK